MKCARCRKWIEKAFWAVEGDWLGKILCRKCKFQVEEIAREKYRKRTGKEYSERDLYEVKIYRTESKEEKKSAI